MAAMALARVDLDLGRATDLAVGLVGDLAAVVLGDVLECGTGVGENVDVVGECRGEGREGGDGEDDDVLHDEG